MKRRKTKTKSQIINDALKTNKIGSKLRIRLPYDYKITDYIPGFGTDKECRKWCIEQAIIINKGNSDTSCNIKDAQKIYDWVTK